MKLLIVFTLICASATTVFGLEPAVEVKEGEAPFAVLLQSCQQTCTPVCTAVVLDANHLLTAASCLKKSLAYIAGITKISDAERGGQASIVISSTAHPRYQPMTGENDIAIINLGKPLVFDNNVKAAILPGQNDNPTRFIADAYGFPADNYIGDGLLVAKDVALISQSICQPYVGRQDMDFVVCTGGVSTTAGDAGGPLIQRGVLIAIAKDPFRAAPGGISAYTLVSPYVDWINSIINH